MDLVQCLLQYHRDRIQPSVALHFSEVQDLADLYSVTPHEILCAMDIAINYMDLDEVKS